MCSINLTFEQAHHLNNCICCCYVRDRTIGPICCPVLSCMYTNSALDSVSFYLLKLSRVFEKINCIISIKCTVIFVLFATVYLSTILPLVLYTMHIHSSVSTVRCNELSVGSSLFTKCHRAFLWSIRSAKS